MTTRALMTITLAAILIALSSKRVRASIRKRLVVPGAEMWGNCQMAWVAYVSDGEPIVIMPSESLAAIPHAAIVRKFGDGTVLHEFVPVQRKQGVLALLASVIFRGKWQDRVIGQA
jgi:hypothetical protein